MLRSEGHSERAIFVIDKKGIIRYVDVHDIDTQPDNDLLFSVLSELEPALARAHPFVAPPPTPEPAADIVMYCTPWCPECKDARVFLNQRGIRYIEVDISRDRSAAQRVREWSGGYETTPTFKIMGEVVVDFDKAKLIKLLTA